MEEKTGRILFPNMVLKTTVAKVLIRVQLTYFNQSGRMDGLTEILFQNKMMLMKPLTVI